MTQAGAKKWADIIKAFGDGFTIQVRHATNGDWYDIDYPDFSEGKEYRVKPEPRVAREWDIALFENGDICRVREGDTTYPRAIRVREVMTGEEGV